MGKGSKGKGRWASQPGQILCDLSYCILEVVGIFCLKNDVPGTQAGGWGTRWHLDYPTTLTVLCSFGSCPSHIRLTSHLLGRWTGLSQLMLNWSPWNPKLFSTIITPSRQLVYNELPLPWTAPQSSRQLEAEARQGCWEARLPTVGPVEDGLREEQKKGQVGPRYLSIMFSLRQWTCY